MCKDFSQFLKGQQLALKLGVSVVSGKMSNCIIGVVRHTERADAPFIVDSWGTSDDSEQWPFDPPLSEDGLQAAAALALTARVRSRTSSTSCGIAPFTPGPAITFHTLCARGPTSKRSELPNM